MSVVQFRTINLIDLIRPRQIACINDSSTLYDIGAPRERESFSPNWKSGFCGLVCISVCMSVHVYGGEEQTNERTKATQSHCMSPPTPHSRHLSEQDHKE